MWSALPLSLKTIRTAGPDEVEGQTVTSKLDVINQKEQATGDFVVRAREYICSENHRGSINYHRLDEIGELLRSFSEALRVASKRDGLADKSELSYFHEWTTNGLAEKIAYELKRDEHPCAHAKALVFDLSLLGLFGQSRLLKRKPFTAIMKPMHRLILLKILRGFWFIILAVSL